MIWHKKALLFFIIIVIFPPAAFLEQVYQLPYVEYYDEITAVFCLIYLAFHYKQIKKSCALLRINQLLGIVIAIGIVSYVLNGTGATIYNIAIDILSFIKRWVIFETIYLQKENIKQEILFRLRPLCKIVILFVFFASVLCQLFPALGTGEHLSVLGFSLTSYCFLWKNGIQTIWLISGAVIPVVYRIKCDGEKTNHYIYLWLISTCLTLKTTGFCLVLAYIVLNVLLRKETVIKWYHILSLGLLLLICGYSAVQTYFLTDIHSPRLVLLLTGFKAALRFFPLGAGFAMYGSAVANKLYSPLYSEYGFTKSYALSNAAGGGSVLNDNYLGMLIGQFGFFGLAAAIGVFYIFFRLINKTIYISKITKVCILSIYITILVTLVGSATSNSMMGVWTMAIIGLVLFPQGQENKSLLQEETG